VAAIAPEVAAMLGPETALVTAQNGIPWWHFHTRGGPLDGRALPAVDPDGAIAALLPSARIIGSVVYRPASSWRRA